jgi:hypothetical protein
MTRPRAQARPSTLVALALVAAALALAGAWALRHFGAPRFSKLWELYSYSTNVAATAYESPRGGATVIWVSGADDLTDPWGQVWNVYSFTNSVTASVYDSAGGGATIIWLSGADDIPRAKTNSVAKPPPRAKTPPRKNRK